LVAGALLDWASGIAFLLAPGLLISKLGLPKAENTVYIRLVGLLLIVLGIFFAVTAIDPDRYLGNVGVAILGRVLGPIFYLTYILFFKGPRFFWVLVALDLGLAFLHAWALGPDGWHRMCAALCG
jgi:hypothetical protein